MLADLFQVADLPGAGSADTGNPGAGMSISSRTNEMVTTAEGEDGPNSTVVAPGLLQTQAGGHTVLWWILLVAAFFVYKYFTKRDGEDNFSTLVTIFDTTLEVIIGITLFKWVFGIYQVPGWSAIVEAA